MASLDWSRCPAVDLSIDEVIEPFDVTREQVAAVLEFVAQSLRASDVPSRDPGRAFGA